MVWDSDIPLKHSTPSASSSFARLLVGSLVRARTAYGEGVPSSLGARMAGMTCIPWAPVAPMTRINFLSDMLMQRAYDTGDLDFVRSFMYPRRKPTAWSSLSNRIVHNYCDSCFTVEIQFTGTQTGPICDVYSIQRLDDLQKGVKNCEVTRHVLVKCPPERYANCLLLKY